MKSVTVQIRDRRDPFTFVDPFTQDLLTCCLLCLP